LQKGFQGVQNVKKETETKASSSFKLIARLQAYGPFSRKWACGHGFQKMGGQASNKVDAKLIPDFYIS